MFKKVQAAHVNTFSLGETGRYRTNVWTYQPACGARLSGKLRQSSIKGLHEDKRPQDVVRERPEA